LYIELLLLASVVSAVAAIESRSSKGSRFGISFYGLFSSLIIYGLGEVLSALLYLVTLGLTLTACLAFLEGRFNATAWDGERRLWVASSVILVFVAAYLLLRQLIYAIPASIASFGALTISKRKSFFKTVIGIATFEGALFVLLAKIRFFTAMISAPLCFLMLVTSLGLPYFVCHRD
jgi:hypothetical protein